MWHSALPLAVQEPRDQMASPESISQGKGPEVGWGTDRERDPTLDRQLHVFLLFASLQASFPDSFEYLPQNIPTMCCYLHINHISITNTLMNLHTPVCLPHPQPQTIRDQETAPGVTVLATQA